LIKSLTFISLTEINDKLLINVRELINDKLLINIREINDKLLINDNVRGDK
jgi:hypothetical protein